MTKKGEYVCQILSRTRKGKQANLCRLKAKMKLFSFRRKKVFFSPINGFIISYFKDETLMKKEPLGSFFIVLNRNFSLRN